MKSACVAGMGTAMLVAFSMAPYAQQPQSPAPRQQSAAQAAGTEQQISVSGCVQREADYRKALNKGKGGVAGTGLGADNEFVLVSAQTPGAAAVGAPTGTAGSTSAYELTGANEGQVGQFVGKRVEITGKLKAQATDASGRPSGGPTAGKPPEGIDITGGDLKLRELEVVAVKEASGTCAAP